METAKRAKARPTCPQCGGNQVKTLGGGTHGKYRYSCQHCSANWQQVPPHRLLLADGSDAGAPTGMDCPLKGMATRAEGLVHRLSALSAPAPTKAGDNQYREARSRSVSETLRAVLNPAASASDSAALIENCTSVRPLV